MNIDDRGLVEGLVGDGRPLISLTGIVLIFSGAFAIFLSATGQFLPHDLAFLGMSADELCAVSDCRVVYFMFHDRVSFGGTLIAIGVLYLWLLTFPLATGSAWAWWALAVSGALGFTSFLSYLGYGYLDTWHGVGTIALLPLFVAGLWKSADTLNGERSWRSMLVPGQLNVRSRRKYIGRGLLVFTGGGMVLAGLTIMVVGMTTVFVPQDLTYMGITADQLRALNPQLVPLIAHDRAGFGGGLASCGVLVLLCVWCGRPSRSRTQVLAAAGLAGFGCAIGVHGIIGYTDFLHLAPAYVGLLVYASGMLLTTGREEREQDLGP